MKKHRLALWYLAAGTLAVFQLVQGGGCKGEVTSPDVALSAVEPAVVCGAQQLTPVKLSGSGFAPLPVDTFTDKTRLELPQVILTQRSNPDGSPGAAGELVVPDGVEQAHVRWQSAETMEFDVYPGMVAATGMVGTDLSPGLYDVAVQNPDKRRGLLAASLAVVKPPRLTGVTPNPACNEQAEASFTLAGSDFLKLDGALPKVSFTAIDAQTPSIEVTATTANNCTQLPSPMGVSLESCAEIVAAIPQQSLPAGTYKVAVRNPGSASCVSQEDVRTVVIPPPTVTSTQALAVCSIAATTLQVTGTNFLMITQPTAATPTVTIGTQSFPSMLSDCVDITDAPGAQLCTTLTFTVPANAFPTGMYQAMIKNPGADACSVAMSLQIDVVGPPTFAAMNPVTPTTICSGGGKLTLSGTNFYTGGSAIINTTANGMPGGTAQPRQSLTFAVSNANQTADAQFSGPLTVGGLYTVTVRNAPGCEATTAQIERVSPGPSILFVDPPAVPNVVSIQATVYASSVGPPIKSIRIAPAGTMNYTTWTTTTTPPLVLDPARPNRALITLPAGLAAGKYDVVLDDQTACPAFLPGGLTVVQTPTLTVTSATPAFGSAGLDTAIVIAGTGFVSTPRAYLNPTGNPPGSRAQALSAVTFQSATSLSAVVRSGLTPGDYDLLVVNPNGAFGIKPRAFKVTAANAPPPVVTSVAPSSLVTASSTPVTINGTGFRAGATVGMTCYDATGAVVAGSAAAAPTAITATTISVNITGVGQYCIVRVTNQDTTYFDYSAVGITNSSLNLTGFKLATSLTTGRRALAAVAGRPTAVARFVYAIGGDNGQDNAPMSSVEMAPTALNGDLGSFIVLSQPLPKALSFLSVVNIGRFLYAVGGFDGAAAVKDVYRSELLSPLNAPQFSDVDVSYSASTGLGAGVWTYRIAAVLSAADPNNPNGETLAGDPFPVQLPVVQGGLQLLLFWPSVTNAVSYKIYRTPKVNDATGKELLLATVPANMAAMTQQYTDDGSKLPAGAAPLPLGSTGTWRAIAQLATARAGAGVAAAVDPTNPALYYLYAVGGNSGTLATPTALRTVEFLPITLVNGGQTQTFTTWTAATSQLATGRWALAALPATSDQNNLVPAGRTYLYAGSGSTNTLLNGSKPIEVAQVQAGGQLLAFTDSGSVGINNQGYGGALVNNQMMAFGGFGGGGTAQNGSVTATLKTATTLNNFNSLGGGVLLRPRALQGTALESAFIYQLGGANAGVNSAQNTTEQTIW